MKTKLCPKCQEDKPVATKWDKHRQTRDGLQTVCRDCKNAIRRQARRDKKGCYADEYERNRESHLEVCKRRRERHKQAVYEHYCPEGIRCARCGFDDQRALSIDHKNSDGACHRKTLGGKSFLLWLIKNEFPPEYQVLCMNCQFIKRHENQEFRQKGVEIHPYRKKPK